MLNWFAVLPQSSGFNVVFFFLFFFSGRFVQVEHEKQHNDLLSLSLWADIPLLAETMFFPFFLTGENTKNIPFTTNQVKHDKSPLKVWKRRGRLAQFGNK